MEERRKYERFQLALPARLEIDNSVKKEIFVSQTRNISTAGAFLLTRRRFSEGTRFRLELTVPSDRIKEITGAQSVIKVKGVVVRSTPDGIAICFDGACKILTLKSEPSLSSHDLTHPDIS
jgi:hypothetical protein